MVDGSFKHCILIDVCVKKFKGYLITIQCKTFEKNWLKIVNTHADVWIRISLLILCR
jgi:hypothetical protein